MEDDDMNRRHFLVGAGAATAATAAGLDPATASSWHVGGSEIAAVRTLADEIKLRDMRHGGGAGLDEAMRDASQMLLLRHSAVPDRLRPELHTALGWLAGNVGFMLHDVGRESEALQWWTTAGQAASEADNWSLLSRLLGMRARQAIWLDRPTAAIADLDYALRDPRGVLTPTERAMLQSLRARALALGEHHVASLAAIEVADSELADGSEDDKVDRPWIKHYGLPDHSGDIAAALGRIARTGHHRVLAQAGGRHELAARRAGTSMQRTGALNMLRLSTLDMDHGDVERAARTGEEALDLAAPVQSSRVRFEVGQLYTAATPHAARSDVADLCDRAAELLGV